MADTGMSMFRVNSTGYHAKVTTEDARAQWVNEMFAEAQEQLRAEFLTMGEDMTARFVVLGVDDDDDLVIHHMFLESGDDDVPWREVEFMVQRFHDHSKGFAVYELSLGTVVFEEDDPLHIMDVVSPTSHPNGKRMLVVQMRTDVMRMKGRLICAEISTGADGKPTVGEWIERKRRNIAEA